MTPLLPRARSVLYNALLDLRFGAPLAGEVRTRYRDLGAKDTANSDYLALDRLFAGRIAPDDILVDIGCGKGRVLNWWLRRYDNPIIGIELDPHIAAKTRARLRRYPNVTILTGNVLDCLPRHGTLFYMYNPFHAEIVQQLEQQLVNVAQGGAGSIRVLYNNCKYLSAFVNSPNWSVELLDTAITDPFDRVAYMEFVGALPDLGATASPT